MKEEQLLDIKMHKIKYDILFFLCVFNISLPAQKTDSDVLRFIEISDKLKYSDIDSAFIIAGKAYELSLNSAKNIKAQSLNNLANIHRANNDFESAFSKFNEAIEIIDKHDSVLISKIYNNMGLTHKSTGRFDSAIVYFHKSLRLRKEEKGRANSLHNIGITYSLIGEFDKSIHYFNECLEICKKEKDTTGIANNYNSIGSVYFDRGELRSAIIYFNKFLELTPPTEKFDIGIAFGNIGSTYESLNELDSAFTFTAEALRISKEINDEIGVVINLSSIGNILRKQNKHFVALELYQQANELADSLNLRNEQKNILLSISETYKKLKQYDKSLEYFEEYTSLKDSLLSRNTQQLIVKEQERYNASEREKDIIQLKAEKEQKERKEEFLMYLIYGIFVFVIVVALFTYILLRERSRKRKSREEQKVALAMLNAEEEERERISHELHDRLGSLLTVVKHKVSLFKDQVEEVQYEQAIEMLSDASSVSRSISHQLFANELKDFGLDSAVENLFSKLNQNNDLQKFTFTSNLSNTNRMNWDSELQLFRITQELINNTLKYAEATQVDLSIQLENDKIEYIYEDNGKGFNYSKVKKGIGLQGIFTRAKSINLNVKINTSTGKGVKIYIN